MNISLKRNSEHSWWKISVEYSNIYKIYFLKQIKQFLNFMLFLKSIICRKKLIRQYTTWWEICFFFFSIKIQSSYNKQICFQYFNTNTPVMPHVILQPHQMSNVVLQPPQAQMTHVILPASYYYAPVNTNLANGVREDNYILFLFLFSI